MRRLALSAGAVLTLAIGVLTAAVPQQSPQSSPDSQPSFKATTRIVNVNVVVTDSHGNPITGLTKDDFELFDRGQPQTIRFFEAINNVGPLSAEPLPPDTYTNQPATKGALPSVTALLVDVQHTDWPAQMYSLYHLRAFLRKLHPDDRIAIYLLTDNQFTLLHDFTQDSSDLIAAIQRYDAQHSVSQKQRAKFDPNQISDLDRLLAGGDSKLSFSQWQAATGINRVPCEGGALQGTADQSAYRPSPPTVHLATVLPDIARHLASASGRKSLIWIFGGTFRKLDALGEFMSPSDLGLQDQLIRRVLGHSGSWTSQPKNQGLKSFLLGSNPQRDSRNPALRDRALQEIRAGLYSGDLVPLLVRLFNDNGIAIYPVGAEGLQTGGIADAGPEDLDFKDPCAATRNAHYGVLAPGPDMAGEYMHAHMMEIAERTGGRAFYSRNDLETGIERALGDGRYSYELAYYPDHDDWTGEWRKIEVKLKDPEKYVERPSGLGQEAKNVLGGGYGVQVLARGGYFALPEPRLQPTPPFDERVLNNTVDAPNKIGMTFRRFTPKEPYNWRGAKTHALSTVVWYPVDASATEKPVEIPGLTIFELGSAAQDAKPAAQPAKFPLIVISHGTGGSGLSMTWLGEALAAHGYIAAAVNHPGNNAAEPYTVEGFSLWWERARDLSEVITGMLADPEFGSHIDSNRIAAAGFSLGGYTMLEIAGGITDAQGFVRYCDKTGTDGICTSPPEFPTLVEDFRKLIHDHPEVLAHAGDSYRDPRVRSVFAIAPPLGPAFPVSGLKTISIPVEIVAGQSDTNVPIESSAKYFAANIPNAKLHIFPGNVAHYVFLDSCTENGHKTQKVLCTDGPGVNRDTIHQQTEKMAIDFFRWTLK